MKVYGCLAYVNNRKREKSKFDSKARKHVLPGYDSNSTAYLLQDNGIHKLTRARNVAFNEKKVVDLTNEVRGEESDLLFDVPFNDEYEAGDSQNAVQIDIKEEGTEIEIKPEVLTDEENSSSSETGKQFELTKTVSINRENEVGPDNQVESEKTLLELKSKHRHSFLERPWDPVHRDLQEFLCYRNGLKKQVMFIQNHK